jgi:hypothetical protein
MKQQNQVNSKDIHPKAVKAMRQKRKRQMKKDGF